MEGCGLEDDFPFQRGDVQVQNVNFSRVYQLYILPIGGLYITYSHQKRGTRNSYWYYETCKQWWLEWIGKITEHYGNGGNKKHWQWKKSLPIFP